MSASGRSAGSSSAIAAVLGLVSLLAGCKVGPDFKRPDPLHVERYTAQRPQVESGAAPGLDQ
jgi:hypothetical protein